jgi:hypothetical protein
MSGLGFEVTMLACIGRAKPMAVKAESGLGEA